MYREHREAFLARMEPGAVAVLPAAPVRRRNGDVEHAYRPDSDFFYLTGFAEPEAVLVLRRPSDPTAPGHMVLFCRPRDREREIWNGKRAGVEGAIRDYGADEAHRIDELDTHLPRLLENAEPLYYRVGEDAAFDARVTAALGEVRRRARTGVRAPTRIIDPTSVLGELRLFKRPKELEVLRRAAAITAEGHLAAMRATRPRMNEYEVQALVEYEFRRRGAQSTGYGSIVAGGANATVLHYVQNDQPLRDGDLLLIDAGAEVDCYTADVTRTFPVGRRFSGPQRAVYEVVLEAQRRAIARCRPGATVADVHDEAVRTLVEGMISLGLLTGSVDENIASQAYRAYYMHRTSHWLGLDVHDVGAYFEEPAAGAETSSPPPARRLQPGMLLTVEPGLYVATDASAPEAFLGIGVRIEDDVLITGGDPEVLTAAIPKRVEDLEALRAG